MFDLRQYDFELPQELIAQFPAQRRDESKLLVLERRSGRVAHAAFKDIAEFLEPEDMIVLNDTKVVPARLYLRRESGGSVEALFVKKIDQCRFACMYKGSGRLKKYERLSAEGGEEVIFEGKGEDGFGLFRYDGGIESLLQKSGVMPLPPYIKRRGRES
ncbi:MAG: S-adenosylmethionine:tRNA ribosyltransferase-isomerase, partial [Deltaproteobacteria bacterium]|nr:S-adenosylmethionine:tRNA ribosyltransferase-isomerase [Deltaproteobacteria bacterium]